MTIAFLRRSQQR